MTIRPLRLEYVGRYKKNYRYATYETHDHRKCRIGGSGMIKATNTFWKKILSYPITALGYDFGFKAETEDLHNPKFDRIDVIKALDFWIEHWVYQNKKDYILEGTVNKDFELTVRELIETREAVLKMPADTQFVRQKIRSIAEIKEIKPKMVEFTENVLRNGNSSASTVDQFCYVVRKMTYKDYMKQLNNPTISKQNGILSDIIQVQMDLREERDDGPRFNFGGLDDEMSPSMWGARHSDGVSVPEGTAVFEIRGPDHLLHSNLHPGIPSSTDDDFQIISVPITASTISITDDESDSLIFENMHLSSMNGMNFTDNSFINIPVNFSSENGTEIIMSIFLTAIQQVSIFDRPLGTTHRIRITPGSQNDRVLEIDGENYHVADINISYNPSRPLSGYIFRDLWVESIESTPTTDDRTLRVDFIGNVGLTRNSISLTLDMNTPIFYTEFLNENQSNRTEGWDLEILGNNQVRIGRDRFRVILPINITIR